MPLGFLIFITLNRFFLFLNIYFVIFSKIFHENRKAFGAVFKLIFN